MLHNLLDSRALTPGGKAKVVPGRLLWLHAGTITMGTKEMAPMTTVAL